MSILLDTGVLYAHLNEDDENADEASAILAACMDGAHGRVLTTSDVVGETFTLLLARGSPATHVEAFANQLGWTTERTPLASVLPVTEDIRRRSFRIFRRHYDTKGLSFTDCTSVVAMRRHGVDAIASFDDDFDGLVERVAE